jgi:hypothetical protein
VNPLKTAVAENNYDITRFSQRLHSVQYVIYMRFVKRWDTAGLDCSDNALGIQTIVGRQLLQPRDLS